MTKFADIVARNDDGHPKVIYDDGDTKLEVWQHNKLSMLNLLIATRILTREDVVAEKIRDDGEDYTYLKLPTRVKSAIRQAFAGTRFQAYDNDVEITDEYAIIRLGDEIESDVGSLLDAENVDYKRDVYQQFLRDREAEERELRTAFYKNNAKRPTDPNVKIIQAKLSEMEELVASVEEEEDEDRVISVLTDRIDADFEEIAHYQQEIPTSQGTEEEEIALEDIDRRLDALRQKVKNRLTDLGCLGWE